MDWQLVFSIVLLLVGISLALYFLVLKKKSGTSSGTGTGTGTGTGSAASPVKCEKTDTIQIVSNMNEWASAPCPAGTVGTARALCQADGTYATPDIRECKPMATIYADINYAGDAWSFGPGEYDVDVVREHLGGDNKASSAKVPAGCTLTLYDGAGFTGTSYSVTGKNQPMLTDVSFNDKTSSLKYVCNPMSGSGSA
jgi:hypothetical protein